MIMTITTGECALRRPATQSDASAVVRRLGGCSTPRRLPEDEFAVLRVRPGLVAVRVERPADPLVVAADGVARRERHEVRGVVDAAAAVVPGDRRVRVDRAGAGHGAAD